MACGILAAPVLPALAFGGGQGTKNSLHDFTTGPWNGCNEICLVCHVLHDHGEVKQRFVSGLL